MKCFKIQITLLFLICYISGQSQGKIESTKHHISIPSNYDSNTINSINKFLNDKLVTISLVRIKPHLIIETGMDIYNSSPNTTKIHHEEFKTIIIGDTIESDKIENSKEINDSDFVTVVQFMFSQSSTITRSRCGYEPRNGILFYGTNHEYLGYIEICFKCNAQRETGASLPPLHSDGMHYEELKNLFMRYNIAVH